MASSQSEIAFSIAAEAHKGQTDKAGVPYMGHPAHVASMVEGDNAKAVAWLHDVVEDTAITFDDLEAKGINDEVICALRLLTHDKAVPYFDYIRKLKENALAAEVKLADLEHNGDLSRLPLVTDEDERRRWRYQRAMRIIND